MEAACGEWTELLATFLCCAAPALACLNQLPTALLQGDAEDLPFPADSFDRYVSAGSIEYWPEPQVGLELCKHSQQLASSWEGRPRCTVSPMPSAPMLPPTYLPLPLPCAARHLRGISRDQARRPGLHDWVSVASLCLLLDATCTAKRHLRQQAASLRSGVLDVHDPLLP